MSTGGALYNRRNPCTPPTTVAMYTADLHLHSSFARATSPALSLATLAEGARLKGLDLLSTGDFTHPQWLAQLRAGLTPTGDGLSMHGGARFVLGTEVSCVYRQDGRGRRVHLLVYAVDFGAVERIRRALAPYGNLAADGRPLLHLSARDTVDAVLTADSRCEVVPAHVWTPWYSALGARGGFDSLAQCFGDLLPHIHAVETGLSSDPAMNWRVAQMDNLAIVSFSDAHSPATMGREATMFHGTPSYDGLRRAFRQGQIAATYELYPQEGKYHWGGHRRCGVALDPAAAGAAGGRCPSCGRAITPGVASRVESLATRESAVGASKDGTLLHATGARPPFRRLVSLRQVIAQALRVGPAARAVARAYLPLVTALGGEIPVLTAADAADISRLTGERIAEGVLRARHGHVAVRPGYDGVYGTIRIWPDGG